MFTSRIYPKEFIHQAPLKNWIAGYFADYHGIIVDHCWALTWTLLRVCTLMVSHHRHRVEKYPTSDSKYALRPTPIIDHPPSLMKS